LLRFIHGNYKSYTLKEIELAFTLAMTRDTLPFMGKNAEVGHYQNFSIEYFCKIMTAYKKYKDHNMKSVLAKQSTFQQIEPPSDKTFLTVNFVNKFKVYLNGGYPWNYGIDIKIFELLVKNGIITIEQDEKIRVGQDIRKQLKTSYKDDTERKNDWIRLSKKRFFMEYIDNCRKEKINLNEIIEKI